jgi:hypothetical protein
VSDAQGRRRLRDLLPAARAQVRNGQYSAKTGSDLGSTTMAHIREENIAAVTVTRTPLGGWSTDVLFRNMPPGIPNKLGTPVETPFRTREEAEAAALPLLTYMLVMAERNKASAPPGKDPVFLLYGHTIRLSAAIYHQTGGTEANGYGNPDAAADRLETFLSEHCPQGFSNAIWASWPPLTQATLMAILHTAALSGLYRYPPSQHRKPA